MNVLLKGVIFRFRVSFQVCIGLLVCHLSTHTKYTYNKEDFSYPWNHQCKSFIWSRAHIGGSYFALIHKSLLHAPDPIE